MSLLIENLRALAQELQKISPHFADPKFPLTTFQTQNCKSSPISIISGLSIEAVQEQAYQAFQAPQYHWFALASLTTTKYESISIHLKHHYTHLSKVYIGSLNLKNLRTEFFQPTSNREQFKMEFFISKFLGSMDFCL